MRGDNAGDSDAYLTGSEERRQREAVGADERSVLRTKLLLSLTVETSKAPYPLCPQSGRSVQYAAWLDVDY